jgi:3-hydroxyacyl-[acyl-carrier-protein] dehydratase
VSVKQMRFRRPARPGDQLLLEVTREKSFGTFAEFKGSARAAGDVVARGSFTIAL